MVGGEIEQHGHGRPEILRPLQLKRVDLKNQEVLILALLDCRAKRTRLMTAHDCFAAALREQAFDQPGGCAFAVGAGNRNGQTLGLLPAQFQFTNQRHIPPRDFLK